MAKVEVWSPTNDLWSDCKDAIASKNEGQNLYVPLRCAAQCPAESGNNQLHNININSMKNCIDIEHVYNIDVFWFYVDN